MLHLRGFRHPFIRVVARLTLIGECLRGVQAALIQSLVCQLVILQGLAPVVRHIVGSPSHLERLLDRRLEVLAFSLANHVALYVPSDQH